MELIFDGFRKAVEILLFLDPELVQITLLTLKVSGFSTFLALLLGLPLGAILGLRRFPARNLLVSLVNAGMGLPPVVVGLFVALLLWRSGPLGDLNLIYTPAAMVVAQTIIAFPIITGFTQAAVQQVDPQVVFQARALGASSLQLVVLIFKEARLAALAAVMAGFGAVISEVGSVLMVGGNLKGYTRVLTTAIVQETRMGHFEMAIALSLILLFLSYLVNYFLTLLQQKGEKEWSYRSWR